jgi:hypothetical protein
MIDADYKARTQTIHHVEIFYDRHIRMWTIIRRDPEDNQIGSADYSGSRAGACSIAGDYDAPITFT